MSAHVLVLNANYEPLKVVHWQDAVLLILDGKADMLAGYANLVVRSASAAIEWPAVVLLRRFVNVRSRLRFNRQNVLCRDNYTCAYCGDKPRTKTGRPDIGALTLDHVIPRAQSRNGQVRTTAGETLAITSWKNVVTACMGCNAVKADRTPEQAGMKLRFKPRNPSSMDILRMSITRLPQIPGEWREYLQDADLPDTYWTVELDPD